jgi:hypothetical protein
MLDDFDRCPVEVWHQIFNVACRDGGQTAHSLSLTSRRAYQLSRHHRFFSIALNGVEQLRLCLQALKDSHISLRTTRYLYVSTPKPKIGLESGEDLYTLLSLVSGTLEVLTLCYAAPFTRTLEDQFPSLPTLSYLSLYHRNLSFIGAAYKQRAQSAKVSTWPKFPSLRDLRLHGELHFVPTSYWSSFDATAPMLPGGWMPSTGWVLQ